ncbi:hypothetical protein PG995_009690, partial [Apiospora arundinis]
INTQTSCLIVAEASLVEAVETAVASVGAEETEVLVVAEMVVVAEETVVSVAVVETVAASVEAVETVAASVEAVETAVAFVAAVETVALVVAETAVATVVVAVVMAAATAVVVEVVRASLVSAEVVVVSVTSLKVRAKSTVYSGGSFPQPSADITKLEDKLVKDLQFETVTYNMGDLLISTKESGAKEAGVRETEAEGVEGAEAETKNAIVTIPIKHIPVRPGYGTKGKSVVVATNYYDMSVRPQRLLQYKLTPTRIYSEGAMPKGKKVPEIKGRKLSRIIQLTMEKLDGEWVSEFKDYVYTLTPLTFPGDNPIIRVVYTDESRPIDFDVKFSAPTSIDFDPLIKYLTSMKDYSGDFPVYADVISAIGAVLGHTPRSSNNVASLGSRAILPSRPPDMNTIIRGYFQSVRPATGRLLLNLNVSHGVFRFAGPVKDLLKQYDQYGLRNVHRLLGRLRAEVIFLYDHGQPKNVKKSKAAGPSQDKIGRRMAEKTLTGLATRYDGSKGSQGSKPTITRDFAFPSEVSFVLDGEVPAGFTPGGKYTVAQYYKTRYNYTVEPNLPVINAGTKDKPIYIPAEFVTIKAGQAVRRKTTPEETRSMIEFAVRSPFANATSIATLGRESLGLDNNKVLNAFNVTVGKNLLSVHARELPTPSIQYSGQKMASVLEGSWNLMNVKVFRSGRPITKCTWVNIQQEGNGRHYNPQELEETMQEWRQFMQGNMGIACNTFKHPAGLQINLGRGEHPEHKIRETLKPIAEAEMVFVVLPGKGTDIYNAVKLVADHELGFHTVCVVRDNLLKRSKQYYANVGLKVNLKMGGANHKLREDIPIFKEGKTMSVGYDVTHPTNIAGSDSLPSIVGMVSSTDRDLAQWPATTWTQTGKQEMLDAGKLRTEFVERVRLWQKANNNQWPDNILIFRDGVSEGQFAQVLTKEVPQMREACATIYPANKKPLFTLVVSVKRHQTRFYPTESRNMTKSRNVKSGTVVDRGVTLARTWDFFLVAHTALQGTARPAHYTVLLDEIFEPKYKAEAANMMEKVVHEMCYLFGRATKAVSICPPAYYADILCTRRRVYMSDVFDASFDDSTTVGSGSQENRITRASERNIHKRLKDTMYYI